MSKQFYLKKFFPLVCLSALQLHAGIVVASDSANIEKITVVGEPSNTEITPNQLKMQQANDLADIFRVIPSVSVGGSLGIAQKIYIRGLEDTLLNVTVDGAQQTGTLFHHIGRVSIEPELLARVEVQSGAGEATSGFGTIGGAIRFKTKDADDLLDATQQFGGALNAGYFSNDGHKTSATLYGRLTENWGLLGSFVDVSRNNMQDGDDNTLFGTAADQTLGFLKLSGNLTSSQSLHVSYERREESGEFGQRPNWPTLAGEVLFPIDGERETVVLNYGLNQSDLTNVEFVLYHTVSDVVQDRLDRWGRYGGETMSTGFDLRNTSILKKHTLTYGIEGRRDEVTSKYLAESSVWADWAWDASIGEFKEKGDVFAVYVQDHWQVNSKMLLSMGARYDSYDLEQLTYMNETSSDGVSPNIGVEYSFTDRLSFNVGHARAIRGKEIGDAFTLEMAPTDMSIATNLQAENVANTEAGLRYVNEHIQLSASIYKSKIDDVIFDQIGGGVFYENIGQLVSDGFELQATYQLDALRLNASYSNNDAKINGNVIEGYEHIGLGNSRGDSWNFSADYIASDSLELGVNITYVSALNNIEVLQRGLEFGWIDNTQFVDKPSYTLVDAYLRWMPYEQFSVYLAVQNLLDKHYRDHSSVGDYNHIPDWEGVAGLYEAGRDIRLSVTYRF